MFPHLVFFSDLSLNVKLYKSRHCPYHLIERMYFLRNKNLILPFLCVKELYITKVFYKYEADIVTLFCIRILLVLHTVTIIYLNWDWINSEFTNCSQTSFFILMEVFIHCIWKILKNDAKNLYIEFMIWRLV